MKRQIAALSLLGIAAISGCALHPGMGNVIPLEGDNYEVITIDRNRDEVLKKALYSAEVTCKRRRMRHIVLDHRTEYRGVLSEDMRPTAEKAQKVFERATGTTLPDLAEDDDYRTTMRFRCEAS